MCIAVQILNLLVCTSRSHHVCHPFMHMNMTKKNLPSRHGAQSAPQEDDDSPPLFKAVGLDSPDIARALLASQVDPKVGVHGYVFLGPQTLTKLVTITPINMAYGCLWYIQLLYSCQGL